MIVGIGGRDRCHGEAVIAQDTVGRIGEVARIDAAGEGHDHAAGFAQRLLEGVSPGLEAGGVGGGEGAHPGRVRAGPEGVKLDGGRQLAGLGYHWTIKGG
jgi:hypothetical protein